MQQIADLLRVPRSTVYGHLDNADTSRWPGQSSTVPLRREVLQRWGSDLLTIVHATAKDGVQVSEHAWDRMTAQTLQERARQGATVLLPIGSTEQHGPHLPTGTDAFLASETCVRVAALLAPGHPVVITPAVWCGLAEHHMALGGTFSLSLGTLHALLHDLCSSILRAGFSNILIVNGHGGNIPGMTAITSELTRELGATITCTTYVLAAPETTRRTLQHQDTVMHACEGETSMIMAVAPDLVHHDRLADAHGPALGLTTELTGLIYTSRSFADLTTSGVAGDARTASSAKGEALLTAYARGIADALLHDQPFAARNPTQHNNGNLPFLPAADLADR